MTYYEEQCVPNGRGRSWEHCYRFFQQKCRDLDDETVRHDAALQLGFYLASWGMYRGSSFLLNHPYTVHVPVVSALASSFLWEHDDVGTLDDSCGGIRDEIMRLVRLVRGAYPSEPTETLITKVLLGTVGCLPARDENFRRSWTVHNLGRGGLKDGRFVENVLRFCDDNRAALVELKPEIRITGLGRSYPLMKLVDMYFWQTGKPATTA